MPSVTRAACCWANRHRGRLPAAENTENSLSGAGDAQENGFFPNEA